MVRHFALHVGFKFLHYYIKPYIEHSFELYFSFQHLSSYNLMQNGRVCYYYYYYYYFTWLTL